MKKILFLLFLSSFVVSGCTREEPAEPLKPGDVSPFFRAYERAVDVKKNAEERNAAAEEILAE